MIRLGLVLLFLGGVTSSLLAQVNANDTLSVPPNRQALKNKNIITRTINEQDSVVNFREGKKIELIEPTEIFFKDHDPKRAAWYSAAIPGLGQAYNKKYWKIPLVWAGIGGFAYFINYNNDLYQFYRKNLIYETEQNPDFINETPLEVSSLKSARDQFRRNRDMLIIYGVIFYMLNIVDAHVDAHLIGFDVNQDLSVYISPSLQSNPNGKQSTGLSLKINF